MRIAYWRNESVCVLRQCAANCKKAREILTGREASLRQYNGGDSNVPSLVLFSSKKETLQVIRRVSPIR
jgi:hypothetical protein